MATNNVHHGISPYIDHDRSWAAQRQWLVSDRSATVWTNVLAIFLTLATARFFPIFKRVLTLLWPDKKPRTAAAAAAAVGARSDSVELNQQIPRAQRSTVAAAAATGTPGGPANGNATGNEGSTPRSNAHVTVPEAAHSATRGSRQGRSIIGRVQDQEAMTAAGVDIVVSSIGLMRPGAINLPPDQGDARFRPLAYLKEMSEMLQKNSREITLGLAVGLGLISLQVSFMAVSIFSGLVVSNSVALSQSPHCSLILPVLENASAIVIARWSKHFQALEVESAEYARRCYPANARSEECSYFYNQSIHFSVKHNDTCPFRGDLCLYGPSGAFTMTTGMVHPKTIGINTQLNYRFERTTTCSPLRMDEGKFLQRYSRDGTVYFRYLYGRFKNASQCDSGVADCTWDLPIEITKRPAYRVFGTSKGPSTSDAGWQPISDLDGPNNSSVALILIANTGISYPAPSYDPIFPAQKQLSDGLFYNMNGFSTALACHDRTTYCDPDGVTCGTVQEIAYRGWKDDESRTVFTMLAHSLVWSDTGNAIKQTSGEALEAQSNLIGGQSLILAEEQWKVEAERLFANSLARIQVTARNIARGPTDDLPPSRDLLEEQPAFRSICHIYKFRSTGWKNLSVAGFLGSFLAGTVLIVLSFPRKDTEELWIESYIVAFAKSCKQGWEFVGGWLKHVWDETCKAARSARSRARDGRRRENGGGRVRRTS